MSEYDIRKPLVNFQKIHYLKQGSLRGTHLGPDAIRQFGKIIDVLKPQAVGFVTSDSSYKYVGAWDVVMKALVARNIPYTHFDQVFQSVNLETVQQSLEVLNKRPVDLVVSIGEDSVTQNAKLIANKMDAPLIAIPTTLSPNHFSSYVSLSDNQSFFCVPRIDYIIFDTNFLQCLSEDEYRQYAAGLFTYVITLSLYDNAGQFLRSQMRDCALHIAEGLTSHDVIPVYEQEHSRFWLAHASYYIGIALQEVTFPLVLIKNFNSDELAALSIRLVEILWDSQFGLLQYHFEDIFGKKKISPQDARYRLLEKLHQLGIKCAKSVTFDACEHSPRVKAFVTDGSGSLELLRKITSM